MKSKIRLITVTTLCTTMLSVPLFSPVSAQVSNSKEVFELSQDQLNAPINLLEDNPIPGVIIKDITREEYVKNVAENENITYDEADQLVSTRTAQGLQSINNKRGTLAQDDGISWRQASWTQAYSKNSNYKATLVASFEIFSSGSFRQINSATCGSSLAAGEYSPTWQQSNSWKTTVYPVSKATVGVTGNFYTVYNNSAGISGGLPGFNVSVTTSTSITYVSDPMTIQREYSLY
ncbi:MULTISPECIES: hypothetical protein [Lysinibacillus]|uniref:hypothetical protein n=1 Tax=Lysinibacillus TaxID=400634 RepID=UPI00257B31B4|nr:MULTISPECIES: hypothetical protein [Lysinibacillus]